jgi:hypothetical protein
VVTKHAVHTSSRSHERIETSHPHHTVPHRPSDVFPTPGGPAKQMIAPVDDLGASDRTARNSRIRRFTCRGGTVKTRHNTIERAERLGEITVVVVVVVVIVVPETQRQPALPSQAHSGRHPVAAAQ